MQGTDGRRPGRDGALTVFELIIVIAVLVWLVLGLIFACIGG